MLTESASVQVNISNLTTTNSTDELSLSDPSSADAAWKARMRDIQGGLLVASMVEMLIGATGLASVLLRYIGPLTMMPVITLVALPLFNVAADYCAKNWWIAFLTIILVVVFSQFLRRVQVNFCVRHDGRWEERGFPLFAVFSITLAITGGLVAGILLTASDSVPPDPSHWSYWARVDTKIDGLYSAPVFRVPYPFQWGLPTFSLPGILTMLLAVCASIVVSVDDYCACARLVGVTLPPEHAVNRGILVEGLSSMIASLVGTGSGLSSFRDHVGAMSVSKVASRRVIVISSVIMIVASLVGKWMALLIMIPEPVIGGVFVVLCGTVAAAGMSNLQHIDLNSSRNLFIIGLSIMFGMALPLWLREHPHAIDSGIEVMDETLNMLGMTSVFVGGIMALLLDNMIPGSDAERGVKPGSSTSDISEECTSAADDIVDVDNASYNSVSVDLKSLMYNLPCCMSVVRRHTFTQFLPFCPTFAGFAGFKQRLCRSRNERSPVSATAVANDDDVQEPIELQ